MNEQRANQVGDKIKAVKYVSKLPPLERMALLDSFPKPLREALKNANYDYCIKGIPQKFKGMKTGDIVRALVHYDAVVTAQAYADRGFTPRDFGHE
jgi:predicted GTPase